MEHFWQSLLVHHHAALEIAKTHEIGNHSKKVAFGGSQGVHEDNGVMMGFL